jgi:hypothetical protein
MVCLHVGVFGEEVCGDAQCTGTARGLRGAGAFIGDNRIADFLAKNTDVKRVWVSNPSWPNHKSVFTSAGLEVARKSAATRSAPVPPGVCAVRARLSAIIALPLPNACG